MSEIRIVAEIELMPEFKDELAPIFRELIKGSRAEAGNIEYDFTEKLDVPCHYFIIETWASAAAIEEHNTTPHFQAFVKALDGKIKKLVITKTTSLDW